MNRRHRKRGPESDLVNDNVAYQSCYQREGVIHALGKLAEFLLRDRRAADLIVFQDTDRTVELEVGALAAVLLSDHDGLVGGMGGDGGDQGGDHEAFDQFGRLHLWSPRCVWYDANVRRRPLRARCVITGQSVRNSHAGEYRPVTPGACGVYAGFAGRAYLPVRGCCLLRIQNPPIAMTVENRAMKIHTWGG